MYRLRVRLAGAPISWGVCSVPNWGVQLPAERVLREVAALGLTAIEAGPPGFLPVNPVETRAMLRSHRVQLVGGFVTAVLHEPSLRKTELAKIERQASWLAAVGGADVLVLAATTRAFGYESSLGIDDVAWSTLVASLDAVADVAARHQLKLVVHPHWGTAIERTEHIERFLAGCEHGMCLDTGHVSLAGADVVAVANRAAERIRHVHLKDVDASLARRVRGGILDYAEAVRLGLYGALGDGAAQISSVLAQLEKAKYGGWYVLEQDVMLQTSYRDPIASVRRSVEFARTSLSGS